MVLCVDVITIASHGDLIFPLRAKSVEINIVFYKGNVLTNQLVGSLYIDMARLGRYNLLSFPIQNKNIPASRTQNHDQLLGRLDFVCTIVWVTSYGSKRGLSTAQPVSSCSLTKSGFYYVYLLFILRHFDGIRVVLLGHNIKDHVDAA